MEKELKLGVIGAGYWGPNLVRNINEAPGADIVAVADLDPERLGALHKRFPGVRTTTDHRELLDDPAIDAVCIVTPADCAARSPLGGEGQQLDGPHNRQTQPSEPVFG